PAAWLAGADESCFFCRDIAEHEAARESATETASLQIDRDNLVLLHGPLTLTAMNRYPYNNGHLLIAPRRHVAGLEDLNEAEHAEIAARMTQLVELLKRLINAQGFNIGLNLGNVAGAGVPGHLHWHIVPRWAGDTNFMPVVGAVDIISQSLESLWEAIRAELE
ncbi:MAG: HIT domain-containing protein, partial [Pirellulales bacterium]